MTLHRRASLLRLGALGTLGLASAALPAWAQDKATAPAAAAVAASSARLLVAHPVVAALTQALARETPLEVLRPAPESLPANRLQAFFNGRGAAALNQAAARADAVVALRSIWPDDPLFPLARRQNIRLIEIDAARPLDASLPGIALQEQAATANHLPWLDPVNLGRMADVIAADLGRLVPQAKPRLQANAAALRQQLLAITAQSEARLATASNVAVFSLSDRLDYLVNGFNLDLAGSDAREDAAWTPEAVAAFTQQLKTLQPAAVLHHREVPAALAQAAQQAGVRLIVLQTEGRDPVGDLRVNAERLAAIAAG